MIAESISEVIDVPVVSDILYRVHKRRPQARLDFEKRLGNIKDVFEADPGEHNDKKIILVDDVVTSGATVLEARKVLENSGCQVTAIISIAHGV